MTEFHQACHADADEAYPYGALFDAKACNGLEAGIGSSVAVQAFSKCARAHKNGFVYDTVGNVAEWDEACEAHIGASDRCRTRGGSFADDKTKAHCEAFDDTHARSATSPTVGFRCCGP